MPLAIALAILLSGAALTAAGGHWRAPAVAKIDDVTRRGTARAPGCRPQTDADRPRASWRRSADTGGSTERREARLRARSPRSLLRRRARRRPVRLGCVPGRLSARDLRARGALQPRALPGAARAVRRCGRCAAPVRDGALGGYRRHESCLLLRWLSERDAGVPSEPACVAGDVSRARAAGVNLAAMRAALFRRHGGPEVMEVGESRRRRPGLARCRCGCRPPR